MLLLTGFEKAHRDRARESLAMGMFASSTEAIHDAVQREPAQRDGSMTDVN
ncbi:MAG: hypothetical protein NZM37_01080 [Sandaracinaceae bacterium]|nr:hypothetical protein [Sandaracinaceae bacterium]MDW8245038.1 hypothetical protein [Sandaracinaceae bacterium]